MGGYAGRWTTRTALSTSDVVGAAKTWEGRGAWEGERAWPGLGSAPTFLLERQKPRRRYPDSAPWEEPGLLSLLCDRCRRSPAPATRPPAYALPCHSSTYLRHPPLRPLRLQ